MGARPQAERWWKEEGVKLIMKKISILGMLRGNNKLITLVVVEIMYITCKSRHSHEIQIADKITQHSASGIVIRCYHNTDLSGTDRTNCDC